MSLRDTIEAAVNTVETQAETPATPDKVEPVAASVETQKVEAVETPEQKAGRTAGRARDEHGRLMPGKAEKPVEAIAEKPAEPQKQRPPRPSSWKKEMWDHYDKLDPQVAEYVHQREAEFA